mgnify:CR=1 FL=1
MSSTIETMRERLEVLAPSSVEIIDDSALHAGHAGARGGGGHYRLRIVSDAFSGKSTLARHRLVYQTLGDMMQHEIHALAIEARSSAELLSQNQ